GSHLADALAHDKRRNTTVGNCNSVHCAPNDDVRAVDRDEIELGREAEPTPGPVERCEQPECRIALGAPAVHGVTKFLLRAEWLRQIAPALKQRGDRIGRTEQRDVAQRPRARPDVGSDALDVALLLRGWKAHVANRRWTTRDDVSVGIWLAAT